MYKRGQFFLIAALVIVMVIVGFGAVYNSIRVQKEDARVFDLTNEIKYEGSQVIDNGVFQSKSQVEIDSTILSLTRYYSDLNPDSEILVVYGNANATFYRCDNNEACISSGGVTQCQTICHKNAVEEDVDIVNNKIRVVLEERSNAVYDFDLQEGQNFYIVVRKEKGGERIVSNE